MGLDDSRIVQMELVYLVNHMLPDRLSDGEVPAIHSNRNINICCLHGCLSVSVGTLPSGQGSCPLLLWGCPQLHAEALTEIHPAGYRIIDQKFFGAVGLHAAFKYEVGTVHDGECFAHVVVGDENA